MANPTTGWDRIPVFGWYFGAGEVPIEGQIQQQIAERVNLVDGTGIYPKDMVVTTTIGDPDAQDPTVRSMIRQAYRDLHEDANSMPNGPGPFNGTAFDAWWDARLPAAVFTSFYAADDPNIVQTGYQVKITEQLAAANGQTYYIQPLLSDLDNPIPGINLGLVDVPPGAPTAPAPIYQKGQPGGVASLDADGKVPLDQLPDDMGGGGGLDEEQLDLYLEGAGGITNAKVTTGAAIALSKTADSTASAGRLAMTNAERSKLAAVEAGALGQVSVDARADARIANWVGAAPGALNTLDELAAALGDDANFAATLTSQIAGKADDSVVVKVTGAQTVAGVKTFSSAPVVPDGSFGPTKVTGVVKSTGAESVAGVKTFTSAPVVPAGSFPQTAIVGAELVWPIWFNSDTDTWPAEGSAEAPTTANMPAGMRRKMISVGDAAAPMPTALLRSGVTSGGHPVLDSWLPHSDSFIWDDLA